MTSLTNYATASFRIEFNQLTELHFLTHSLMNEEVNGSGICRVDLNDNGIKFTVNNSTNGAALQGSLGPIREFWCPRPIQGKGVVLKKIFELVVEMILGKDKDSSLYFTFLSDCLLIDTCGLEDCKSISIDYVGNDATIPPPYPVRPVICEGLFSTLTLKDVLLNLEKSKTVAVTVIIEERPVKIKVDNKQWPHTESGVEEASFNLVCASCLDSACCLSATVKIQLCLDAVILHFDLDGGGGLDFFLNKQ